METGSEPSIIKKFKTQWVSIVLIGFISVLFVVNFFDEGKNNPDLKDGESASTTSPASNPELDAAKDNALFNPSFVSYLNLGTAYYKTGQQQNCITMTLKALEYPATPDKQAIAYNNLCSAYNVLKMPDEAIKACEEALKLQPDFERAKNNLKSAVSLKNSEDSK